MPGNIKKGRLVSKMSQTSHQWGWPVPLLTLLIRQAGTEATLHLAAAYSTTSYVNRRRSSSLDRNGYCNDFLIVQAFISQIYLCLVDDGHHSTVIGVSSTRASRRNTDETPIGSTDHQKTACLCTRQCWKWRLHVDDLRTLIIRTVVFKYRFGN